jgi:predicted tellurium resistance membrane protein TerC
MSTKNTTSKNSGENNLSAVFGKKNYIIMAAGVALMAIGYLLMIGGRAENPAVFNPDEIYSSTRITVAPILIILGIAVNIYAILAKNK